MNGLHLIADLHDCRCVPGFLLDAPGSNRSASMPASGMD